MSALLPIEMKIDCSRQAWTERLEFVTPWAPVGAKNHFYLVSWRLVLTLACLDNLLELLKGDPLATELLGQV